MGVPDNLPPEATRFTAVEWMLLGWVAGVVLLVLVLVGGAFAIGVLLRAP